MGKSIIELDALSKKYGSFTAVDELSLTISKGEIFGLLGPNGAGKSTTILMILGLTEPTSGSVHVCGISSTNNPIEVKRRVGYLPEDVGFYDDLTGLENLMFTARLNSIKRNEVREKSESLLKRVGLEDNMNKKAGKYSRGMRQRLGLADVLIKDPEVIILDEPTLGIDPTGVNEFLELIVKLSKDEGITVLISSHHLHQIQQICDRVGLFIRGKLIAEGDVQTLSKVLFSNELFSITAGVTMPEFDENSSPGKVITLETLESKLKKIEGVKSLTTKNNIMEISCATDAAPGIAKVIVESGVSLNYLHKKEYGLNEIYQRYFEGSLNDE